jgi:hypothetical protein
MKTLRVCPDNLRHVRQESLACGIASQSRKPLGSRMMMSLRELQSATGDELRLFVGWMLTLCPLGIASGYRPRNDMCMKVNAL